MASVKSLLTRNEFLEMEAVRAVRSCTVIWKPATLNGSPTRQTFVLPVNFRLTNPEVNRSSTAKPIKTGINLAMTMGDRVASTPKVDSRYLSPGKSFFGLTLSDSTVQLGECFVAELAFYVPDDNTKRIRFWDLGIQIQGIIDKVEKDSCWVVRSHIRNVVAEYKEINSIPYTKYTVYRAAMYPTKPGFINFPVIKVDMLASRDRHKGDTALVQTPYFTLPAKVRVNRIITSELVGRFAFSDSIQPGEIFTDQPVLYQVTVAGLGHLYPVGVPTVVTNNWEAEPVRVLNADTVLESRHYSAKTITYRLLFKRAGEYDLADGIGFSALDPGSHRIMRLAPNRKVTVSTGKAIYPPRIATIPQVGMIAIDVSESMLIEDVQPTRLAMTREGVADFLEGRKCDIGLMAFGGNVLPVSMGEDVPCIPRSKILNISPKMVQAGTALGEVIWEACHPVGSKPKPWVVVIISDGDNTAGRIKVSDAIRIAAASRVKVFTIGVGKNGPVAFGTDAKGRTVKVENTFSDVDLKKISRATGGTYVGVSTSVELRRALNQIFSTQK